jgi:hypothetical protein
VRKRFFDLNSKDCCNHCLPVVVLVRSGDHTIKLHSWPAGKPAQVLQDNRHTRTPWTVSGCLLYKI